MTNPLNVSYVSKQYRSLPRTFPQVVQQQENWLLLQSRALSHFPLHFHTCHHSPRRPHPEVRPPAHRGLLTALLLLCPPCPTPTNVPASHPLRVPAALGEIPKLLPRPLFLYNLILFPASPKSPTLDSQAFLLLPQCAKLAPASGTLYRQTS